MYDPLHCDPFSDAPNVYPQLSSTPPGEPLEPSISHPPWAQFSPAKTRKGQRYARMLFYIIAYYIILSAPSSASLLSADFASIPISITTSAWSVLFEDCLAAYFVSYVCCCVCCLFNIGLVNSQRCSKGVEKLRPWGMARRAIRAKTAAESQVVMPWSSKKKKPWHALPHTANLRTKIPDFRGFDPSRI